MEKTETGKTQTQDEETVVTGSYVVYREAKEDWMQAEVDDKELMKIAESRRRAKTVEFEVGKSFVCKVVADPRIISTKEGPWEVMDVIDKKGNSAMVSLGHQVLAKQIRERLTKLGTLVGQVLVILPLGKPEGKRYFNYSVLTWDEYKVGFPQTAKKVKREYSEFLFGTLGED